MVDRRRLLQAFEECARALLTRDEVEDILDRLSAQVVGVLGVDGAGVTICHEGRLIEVAATCAAVAAVQEHSTGPDDGPCRRSFGAGQQVLVEDFRDDDRWPALRDRALGQGFRAMATLPMPVDGVRVGALDLYRHDPHDWTPDEIRTAQVLADMVSGAILNQRQLSESRDAATRLQAHLDARILVEQATGILCGRHGLDAAGARARLGTHARTFGSSLQDVCERVVAGDLRL